MSFADAFPGFKLKLTRWGALYIAGCVILGLAAVNTGNNLPAQIEIYATKGNAYTFLFVAKGGGSANKTYLYQETKAVLNPDTLIPFITAKMKSCSSPARSSLSFSARGMSRSSGSFSAAGRSVR